MYYINILVIILSCQYAHGVQYYPSCPSDDPVTDGCPNGWISFMELCYKFETYPQKTYQDAIDYCNGIGAQMLKIDNLYQHEFISGVLNANAVNRSVRWYTAGKMDPAKFGRYIWAGYIPVPLIGSEVMTLFIDTLPDPSRETEWDKDRKQVVYGNDGTKWGFYLTVATDLDFYICQASKAKINLMAPIKRTPDFGQNDPLNIKRGPCVLTPPKDQLSLQMDETVTPSVTFTCEAYGNPTPTIKWFFIQKTQSGYSRTQIQPLLYTSGHVSQTGGLLTFYNPDSSFDNPIECQAENEYGVVISKQVRIIRGFIGKYNKQDRQEKKMADNTGFVLDCEAPKHSPKDSLVYTFRSIRSNDKGMESEDVIQGQLRNNIFLSTNLGQIGFSIGTTKDSGRYICIVGFKGVTGTTNTIKSPNIPVSVYSSNTIYPSPMVQDQYPNFMPSEPLLGDTVEIECFGYGMIKQNPLTYWWLKDGGPLPRKAQISDFGRRVKLGNIQFEDEGEYSCTLSDSDGFKSSARSTKIQVNAKPTFLTKPSNQFLDVKDDVTFVCRAVAKPDVTIRWFRNDVEIGIWLKSNPDSRYNHTELAGQATLSITGVKLSDSAMIGCIISNTLGQDSAYAQMSVFAFAPNFNKLPLLNAEAMAGTSIIMPCQPEGAPKPIVTWSFNDAPMALSPSKIDPTTGEQLCPNNGACMLPNQNLRIDNMVLANKGNYTCTATNSLGSASSWALIDMVNPRRLPKSRIASNHKPVSHPSTWKSVTTG